VTSSATWKKAAFTCSGKAAIPPFIPTIISSRTQRKMKNSCVGGAAVPGRLSLAGTEARPTEIFSYERPQNHRRSCAPLRLTKWFGAELSTWYFTAVPSSLMANCSSLTANCSLVIKSEKIQVISRGKFGVSPMAAGFFVCVNGPEAGPWGVARGLFHSFPHFRFFAFS
jgi:hypothetical protein